MTETIKGISLSHIVAMSENHCIGKNNDLPWHISADLKHFKALTQGGVMVMGRKCYESFGGRPLPKRSHWVVTRNKDWTANFDNTENTSVQVVHDLTNAIDHAIKEASDKGLDTVWVIGGGEIYRETLTQADRLEITHIHKQVDGDTFYPQLPSTFLADFDVSKQPIQHDETSGLSYQFTSYRKKLQR